MPRPTPLLGVTNRVLSLTQRRRSPEALWRRLLDSCERDFGLVPDGPEAEALQQLLIAMYDEPGLSAMGRFSAEHSQVGPRLRNVAQVDAQHRDEPAIAEEPIDDPIFILGLPRTATTVTHRLLAGAQGCRGPLMAELVSTKTHYEDWKKESKGIEKVIKLMYRYEPYFEDIHPLSAFEPEETFFAEVATRFFMGSAPLKGYRRWIDQADAVPWYEYLKRVLQVLQYGRPRQRWVLKQPAHLWHLPEIFKVFPDATIVWCHRDPVTAFGSTCSMNEATWRMHLNPEAVDLHELGDLWLDLLVEGIETARTARAGLPRERIVDVPYHWLTTNPYSTIPALFAQLGVEWDAGSERRLDEHFGKRDTTRRHEYDSSAYGKRHDEVNAAFGDYVQMVHNLNSTQPAWIRRFAR